ncbi:MAG: oxidoreductase [Bacteroidetes bacterium]|nr:MAG: oxidoreductase [Bacteroidota bacterium]TAG91420.1 MAG: oxidoreductase [Bacteroidota bacterium]
MVENLQLLTPQFWADYELLDSGNFHKLERFGEYILIRPEPQAVWESSLKEEEWTKKADAIFHKSDKGNVEKGNWEVNLPKLERGWQIKYQTKNLDFKFKLSLSGYKHVGVFPEQAPNWDFIAEKCQKINQPKVLNLFAYTGGASLAARQAGANITHVDSIKSTNAWAKENMEVSGLDNIRWITEDAMGFVKREMRRNNRYNGIILDPPAYGRGTDGEKWVLEEQINEMIGLCKEILDENQYFFIINLYSLGLSALIVENLLKYHFPKVQNMGIGELYLTDSFQKRLPLGVFGRFSNV